MTRQCKTLLGFTLACTLAPMVGCTPKQPPEATFEQLWQDFDEMYGGFEIRGVDWDDVYDRYRPLIDDDMSDDEFFEVIATMLAETDDGHVQLFAPGRVHWFASQIYRENVGDERFDLELVRSEYLGGEYSTDSWAEHTRGSLATGHPYVHFAGTSDQFPILERMRADAEAAGGMVIDMRHNGGGDFTWAFHTLADWCSTPRPVFRSHTRNSPGRGEFDDWFEWSLDCRGTDVEFDIVVLIDRFTISAGERAVLALATFDTVTFVGEPTNGAVSTTVGRELLNGWYVTISTQEVFSMDGTTIEAQGFYPDEMIVNDPAQMELGVDEVLDRAIMLLEAG